MSTGTGRQLQGPVVNSPISGSELEIEETQHGKDAKQREYLTLRRIVYRGEMNPGEWPKYRYILLEIWLGALSDDLQGFKKSVAEEVAVCRRKVISDYFRIRLADHLTINRKGSVQDLSEEELDSLITEAVKQYAQSLIQVGAKDVNADFEEALANIARDTLQGA